MTAIVVLTIITVLVGILAVAAVGYLKQFKVKALAEMVKVQSTLVLDIEEKCMQYGYSDPLAYDVIQTIREVRKSENKKREYK